MAITSESRTEIIQLVVGMFDAAPGAQYLSEFVNMYEAGVTRAQLASSLTASSVFKSIYPDLQTSNEFATKFINNLLGDRVDADSKAWAVSWIEAQLNAGSSKAEVIMTAIDELSALTSDATWGAAATALANKVEVAEWYSVDQLASSTSLSELQNVVADITEDPATVTAATSGSAQSGQTFTLTAGVDNFTGTSSNDTFIADDTQATKVTSAADVLDGGAGTDSLTIYGTPNAMPQISNIENIEVDSMGAAGSANFSSATGVQNLTVDRAVGAATVTVADGVSVKLSNSSAGLQTVNYGANDTSANLTLSNVAAAVTQTGAKVETLNVSVADAKSTVSTLTTGATTKTINVSGDQDLTITNALGTAVDTFDASALTGKLSVVSANNATDQDAAVGGVDAVDLTIKGGSAADTINVSANAADNEIVVDAGAGDDKVVIAKTATAGYTKATATVAGDSIVGGEGTDTLSVDGDLTADLTDVVSGFEVLEFTGDATGTNMATNKLGISQFVLGDTIDATLTGLAANSTVTLNGAGAGADGSDLVATIGTNTTADVLNVVLESTGATTKSTVTANNYETVNVTSTLSSTDAATVTNTADVTAAAATALNISGTQELTASAITLKAGAAVDASGMSGKLTSTFTSSVKSYEGSTGNDVLAVVAGDLKQGNTFAGGTGTDSLTVTATADQDLGIVGLTGFETLNLTSNATAQDTVVADFRNVTGLETLALAAGDATDNFTLNRLDGANTTLSFGGAANFGNVVTTIASGTEQKVAITANNTVASLTLDSGTTDLTLTADDGDTTTGETIGTFTSISGTSLTDITVLGNDDVNLGTLTSTVTTLDASGSKGGVTVTASASDTSITGGEDVDNITGGAGDDTITGGKGDDVISGAGGKDTIVFADTGANNGTDTLTITAGAGASGDVLNFKNFLSGGSIDQNGGTGTAITAYTTASTSDVDITNKFALYSDATETNIDSAAEIAALIEGAGDAFSLSSGGKAILATGDAASALDDLNIWFIDDSVGANAGTIEADDIVLVGTSATTDLDTLITSNIAFA